MVDAFALLSTTRQMVLRYSLFSFLGDGPMRLDNESYLEVASSTVAPFGSPSSLSYSLVPHSSFLGVHFLVSYLHKPLPPQAVLYEKSRLRQFLTCDLGGRFYIHFFFSIPLCPQLNHPFYSFFKKKRLNGLFDLKNYCILEILKYSSGGRVTFLDVALCSPSPTLYPVLHTGLSTKSGRYL